MTFPEQNIKGRTDPELRENMHIRDVAIISRFELGERAAHLAAEYGLTRERVRQILEYNLGRARKGILQDRNMLKRRKQKKLGKPAVSALAEQAPDTAKCGSGRHKHLHDVASVVAAKPGPPTEAGVSDLPSSPEDGN